MNSPMEYIPAFTQALTEVAETIQPATDGQRIIYIGLKGSFGDHHVNPRTLRAKHLGKLVCLEGIVTRCKSRNSEVRRGTTILQLSRLDS